MWGWITKLFDSVAGAIDETVRRWVHDLIAGLYGFLHTIFGNVVKGWEYFWNAARNLRAGLNRLADEAWQTFYHLYRFVVPTIIKWAELYFATLRKFTLEVWQWAERTAAALIARIIATARDLQKWVVNDIWNPIWHILTQAWDWILHEGATAWHYITHPADLVDLIWENLIIKLEKESWNVGARLGRFSISLIVHNLRTFVLLVEDIIDAIL